MDKLKEECGVIGVYINDEKLASRLVYYGLYALQHRGQESAGITINHNGTLDSIKGMGLVSEVFDEDKLDNLKGNIAIGHVRYSTAGVKELANCQPVVAQYKHGAIALAHNGNLTNGEGIRDMLEEEGAIFHTTLDSESILQLMARQYRKGIESALKNTMSIIKGGYALVITTQNQLIGVRDPNGIRPLCIGQRDDGSYIIASESCALDVIDATFLRDVMPGEVVIIDEHGLKSIPPTHWGQKKLCIFEMIYLARPDSVIDEVSVFEFRRKSGELLASEFKGSADIVIPVPDSGIPGAIGFSSASGLPYMEGLVKNRYVGRTFIQPTQELREIAVKLKLTPLRQTLKDKRVVIIDDSIVRGTTSKRIVEEVKKAGATEVHLCITSPPVKYCCYYGIDTPDRGSLIGANKTVDEICEYLGADSLTYFSLEGLRAVCDNQSRFCRACFNGNYPIEIPFSF